MANENLDGIPDSNSTAKHKPTTPPTGSTIEVNSFKDLPFLNFESAFLEGFSIK
ncbi:hypothetical protein EsCd1HHP049_03005 [Escherichia sp. HH154_1D]|nr:hypothetical protein EsCdI10290_03204 [Escherichia sp. 10290]BDI47118.1 hypothetical protein EsCd1HHP049_03005 [Escherichia sp. HH154_1D]